jgi:glycosyltransferase involved in cell wall biosynthesis
MARIIVATPLYPPDIGGPASVARMLERVLPEAGHQVSVVSFGEVRRLPKIIRHIAYMHRLFTLSKGANIIIALDPVSVGVPAAFVAWLRESVFVLRVPGDYAWEQGVQRFKVKQSLDSFQSGKGLDVRVHLLRLMQRWVATSADVVVVPSAYLARIVSKWGVQKDRIARIESAVLTTALTNEPAHDISRGKTKRIAMVGRFVPWKGMKEAIVSMEALRREVPTAVLTIVGDGPMKKELRTLVREHGLTDAVVFTGPLPHTTTLETIRSSDVLLLNSRYEGLPHLAVEAFSVGTPVVATNAGGIPEVVEHMKTGLVYPVGDESAMVESLSRILSDTTLRNRLGKAAQKAVSRFSEERAAVQYKELVSLLAAIHGEDI